MDFMIIFGSILIIAILIFIWWLSWEGERNAIKVEIERAYEDEERKFWEEKLKRAYVSHIPIINWFFRFKR